MRHYPQSMAQVLRTAETRGYFPRRLPLGMMRCIDKDHGGLADMLDKLGEIGWRMLRRTDAASTEGSPVDGPSSEDDLTTARKLVQDLVNRLGRVGPEAAGWQDCDSSVREALLIFNGHRILSRLVLVPLSEESSDEQFGLVNDCLHCLTELSILELPIAEGLASLPGFIPRLFELMASQFTIDGALTLAQELLATMDDVFQLTKVPQLPELVASLRPRGFALLCRALTVILSKTGEQAPDRPPAPECEPPISP